MTAADLAGDLTVCVCTRDRPDSLRQVLVSIGRNAPNATIVVSDDGEAPARAIAESFPRCSWQPGPATGLGANRNAAVAAVRTERVLFLDDDAELCAGFVEAIAAVLDRLDTVLRPRTIVTGRERQGDLLVAPNDVDFLGFQRRPYADGEVLRTVVINAAVWPTALFETVAFDGRLRYGSDEVDLSYKALRAGYRIADCPDAVNAHHHVPLGREDYAMQAHASRLRATTRRNWSGPLSLIRTSAFLAAAPAHLLFSLVRQKGLGGIGSFLRIMRLWLTE